MTPEDHLDMTPTTFRKTHVETWVVSSYAARTSTSWDWLEKSGIRLLAAL